MAAFNILDQLDANLNRKKISVEEFAESAKYCGKRLYPRQKLLLKLIFLEDLTEEEDRILDYWIEGGKNKSEIKISPFIRERIAHLKDNGYDHFREVVLVGGRRSSKGFVTGIALAKRMFDVMALQDPGQHYGIDPEKEIYFSCVASSQDQAKKYQYADFSSTVNSCAAMQPHISKLQELEFSVATEADIRKLDAFKRQGRRVQRDLSKLRGTALPANASTIRGSATMAICFDEMAHLQEGGSYQSASEVYEAAIPSLAQFGKDAMIFCNSSPYSKVGKFYERWEESQAVDNDGPAAPFMFGIQFPSWALFDGWWEDPKYTGPKKCITVSPDWDPNERIELDAEKYFYVEEDRQGILIAREEERQEPDKYKVERRGKFSEVIDSYLRPEKIDEMFMGTPLADGTGFLPLATNWNVGTYDKRYRAHLDPSSTTAGFGFALGHTEFFDVNGQQREHVVFDVIKRWNPKDFPNKVIDWQPILEEVMDFIRFFQPYELTMDQFNSDFPITWLRRELRQVQWGFETRVYQKTATAQHNWDRAEIFRTALYQGLIHAPYDTEDSRYCADELKFLQEIKSGRVPRIDKQESGPVQTKDMADCVMEVVEALIGNSLARAVRSDLGGERMSLGAEGGYQLGGRQTAKLRDSSGNTVHEARQGEQRAGGSRGNRKTQPNRSWGAPSKYRRFSR